MSEYQFSIPSNSHQAGMSYYVLRYLSKYIGICFDSVC